MAVQNEAVRIHHAGGDAVRCVLSKMRLASCVAWDNKFKCLQAKDAVYGFREV